MAEPGGGNGSGGHGSGAGAAPKRKRGRPPGPVAVPYRRRVSARTIGVREKARGDGLDLSAREIRQVRQYVDAQDSARVQLEQAARTGDVAALGRLWREYGVRYPLVEQSMVLTPGRASASYPGSAGPWDSRRALW